MSTHPIDGDPIEPDTAVEAAAAEPADSVTDGDRQPGRQLHAVPDPDEGGSAEVRTAAHTRGVVNPAVNPVVNLDPDTDGESPVPPEGDADTAPASVDAAAEVTDPAESASDAGAVEAGQDAVKWARLAGLAGWVRPPNVITETPPSWEQIGWRARFGDQVAVEGWTRTAAIGFAFALTWPVRVAAFYADWIARTPSRLAAVLAVYTVLVFAHLPYLGWLPFPLKGEF